jgi:hypothetical protein
MEFSQYVSAAKSAIAYVQQTVRYRGLNTAGGWIRHPTEMNEKVVARVASKIVGSSRSAQYSGPFDGDVYINELDRLAKETSTGNCSELSAVAFNYLRNQGVRPIDYFAVWRGAWNHAFVVLNRPADQPLARFDQWSRYAVVCDPLYDRAGDAGFLATWYPKIYPFTDKDMLRRLE